MICTRNYGVRVEISRLSRQTQILTQYRVIEGELNVGEHQHLIVRVDCQTEPSFSDRQTPRDFILLCFIEGARLKARIGSA